jgi:hypothetical protein
MTISAVCSAPSGAYRSEASVTSAAGLKTNVVGHYDGLCLFVWQCKARSCQHDPIRMCSYGSTTVVQSVRARPVTCPARQRVQV